MQTEKELFYVVLILFLMLLLMAHLLVLMALKIRNNCYCNEFTKKKALKKPYVIGIHMGSSKLAAGKALSPDFVLKLLALLLHAQYKIILFGTKNELKSLHIKTERRMRLAQDQNVIKNLSLVNQCDLMIASDSVFKTMASMLNIPSIVIHKDNKNPFRDRTFIEPYVKAGSMSVYKYKSLEGHEVDTALAFTMKNINALLKAS